MIRLRRAGGPAAATLLALCLCLLYWSAERRLVGTWGFPLDDAWIHSMIARNLVHGHGWSYNPGVPVQNSSGPLWTVLVAAGFKLFGTSVWVPKVLGAACFLATVALTGHLALVLGLGAAAGAGSAILVALCGPLVWHALSGMETILAALLVTAALAAFYAWRAGKRRSTWVVLATLAVWARPETLVLLLLLFFEKHVLGLRAASGAGALPSRSTRRELLLEIGLAALLLAPYFALNLKLSGTLFPSTFAAKVGDTGLLRALGARNMAEVVVSLTLYPYIWSVHALAYFAKLDTGVLLLAPAGAWALWRGPRRALSPALLLFLLPVVRGVVAPHQTPGIHYGRYVAVLLPAYLLLGAAGARSLLVEGAELRRAWSARSARILFAAVLGGCLVALFRLEMRVPDAGGGPLATLPTLIPGHPGAPGLHVLLQTERLGLVMGALVAVVQLVLGSLPARLLPGLGAVLAAGALLQHGAGLGSTRDSYAHNVQNIQDMDVALGKWANKEVPAGASIAVNDIGAIAYFGERPVVDLYGLATPELVPSQSRRHLRTLIQLRRLRPQVFIVFPAVFEEWAAMPSLLQPVLRHRVEHNTILASTVAVAYRADWDRFGRYYSDELLDRLDPPEPHRTVAECWRRGLLNLGLRTRPDLFVLAGDLLRARGDLPGAESQYRAALRLDAHTTQAHLGLVRVQAARRDRQAYAAALRAMLGDVPDSAEAEEALGDLFASEGRDADMLHAYEAALALHPDSLALLSKLESYWTSHADPGRAEAYRAQRAELQAGVGTQPPGR